MKKRKIPNMQINEGQNKLFSVIKILIILFLISWLLAGCLSLSTTTSQEVLMEGKNVAVIKISGPIFLEEVDTYIYSQHSSDSILNNIRVASNNDNIKAVIFEINSPGGTPVASAEIVEAIKGINKTTVAWVREIGASGAYWVASACDHVIAHPLSVVGSIGVYSSYLDFSGLLDDYNVTYNRLNAGDYKDAGTPLKELEEDERELLQSKVDMIYDYFVADVAANRGISIDDMETIATGEFYLGMEGLKIGLVDKLGGYEEAVNYVKAKANITDVYAYKFKRPKTFFERLSGLSSDNSYSMGRGIGDSLAKEQDMLAVLK